jgi:hypothetical protein
LVARAKAREGFSKGSRISTSGAMSSERFSWLMMFCGAAVCALLLSGCAEKEAAVREQFRARFTELRQELAEYQKNLPAEMVALAAPLDPKPSITDEALINGWAGGPASSNLLVLWFEELADPNGGHVNALYNLGMDNGLMTVLKDLDDPYPNRKSKAPKNYAKGLEAMLGMRYLGVVKKGKSAYPEATSDKSFTPGIYRGEVWLIDRTQKKVVFHQPFAAESSEELTAHYKKHAEREMKVTTKLYEDLEKNSHNALKKKLTEEAGVTFGSLTGQY